MSKYFLYADDLPVESFRDPTQANTRRRELLSHRKVARLFALNEHRWREWVHILGASSWHDVEPTHVPFRLLSLDRP